MIAAYVGVILGYYFDKLSLSGIDAFLYNVRKEESKKQPETVYIDVNTGEIVEQAEDQWVPEPAADNTETKSNFPDDVKKENDNDIVVETETHQPEEQLHEEEPISDNVIRKQIILSGSEEQIIRYLETASQFNVKVEMME
ncbi:MAG: hypothetical protein IJJ03_07690 [Mogibacterium sp.]|nr:hypothetical protein [Mogibacterium sp.]